MRIAVIFTFGLAFLLTQCAGPSTPKPNEMLVEGSVDGLRKGTLYLQTVADSVLMNLDSTTVKGTPTFSLRTALEEPQVFYLYLDKEDNDTLNDRILFFGAPGKITINTLLNTYESSAKIEGSVNNDLLTAYKSTVFKFNAQNLELVKQYLDAQKRGALEEAKALEVKMDQLLKRRYLYALNFAKSNANQEVAPYILYTEAYDATLSLLDTVIKDFTPKVKNSRYGKQLEDYLAKRRATENN